MKTVIIYLDLVVLNNFSVLGKVFHTDIEGQKVRVIFQQSKDALIRGGEVLKSFDLAIDDCTDLHTSAFLRCFTLPNELKSLPRYLKSEQMAKLINYINSFPKGFTSNFIIPHTYACEERFSGNEWALEAVMEGRGKHLIVKPDGGAQGRGQIFVSGNRNFSINRLTEILSTKGPIEKFERKLINFIKEHKNVVSLNPLDDPFIAQIDSEEFYFESEAHRYLISPLHEGFIVQELVPDIEHEFRLVSGYDSKITYIQKRAIQNNSGYFPQASGKHENEFRILTGDNELFYSLFNDNGEIEFFDNLVKNIIGPMNSIDVFFTKDGKVGIFEWQHQWGIDGVPKKIAYEIQENFIKDFIIQSKILESKT